MLRGGADQPLRIGEAADDAVHDHEVGSLDLRLFFDEVPVAPLDLLLGARLSREGIRLLVVAVRELHDRLNHGVLKGDEQWPYMPHLTIVKMGSEAQAMSAFEIARERWTMYRGSRQIAVDHLTFVREGENNTWVDLAPIPLGRTLVSGQSY